MSDGYSDNSDNDFEPESPVAKAKPQAFTEPPQSAASPRASDKPVALIEADSKAAAPQTSASPAPSHSPVLLPAALTSRSMRSVRTPGSISGEPTSGLVVLRSARGLDLVKAGGSSVSVSRPASSAGPTRAGTVSMQLTAAVMEAMGGREVLERLAKSASGSPTRPFDKARTGQLAEHKDAAPAQGEKSGAAIAWLSKHVPCSCKSKKCTPAAPSPGCDRAEKSYGLTSEAENCTFRPKIKFRRPEPGENSDVLARMTAAERNRRQALQTKRQEEAYAVRLDKLYCPKCNKPQSHQEMVDGKKRCDNCRERFRPKKQWKDIERSFLSRLEDPGKTVQQLQLLKAVVTPKPKGWK